MPFNSALLEDSTLFDTRALLKDSSLVDTRALLEDSSLVDTRHGLTIEIRKYTLLSHRILLYK